MAPKETFSLRNACIVVAHPDDEILWFSSIVARVARVFIRFVGNPSRPKLSKGRESVLKQLPPERFVSLGLDEADVFDLARWPHPDPSPAGVALPKGMDRAPERRYRANFSRLTDELGTRLAEFDTVFTHNPWGEYGHEEHVQVYRAVGQLQGEIGFKLWCSAYVGSRSHGMMARCLDGAVADSITLDTDVPFARKVTELYKESGAWTWFDDHVWPERESFLRLMPEARNKAGIQPVPLSYLDMGPPAVALADQSLRSLARKVGRRLSLAGRNDTAFV